MEKYINTLNYGKLPIRYNKQWLNDRIIDVVQADMWYEVRTNLNGELIAYQVPNSENIVDYRVI